MLENDGGAAYILKNLEKVCRPETKTDQLNSLAVTLSNELSAQLSEYYVHTNIAERERASMDKFDALITFDSGLLAQYPAKAYLAPAGGV